MLQQLYIHNFTLIDKLDIHFSSGFSVITGETGAGKSIILGAIGLLLGNRADARLVKAGTDKCIVEAHFDISRYDMQQFFIDNDIDYEPDDCIMRRELRANGKSRAFINDTPVSLTTARELGEQLVDIHSQHQNLLLQKDDFQLSVVDIIANNSKELQQYRTTYREYSDTKAALKKLEEQIAANRANEDFLRYQAKELADANLVAGELTELEQEVETLSHTEDIKTALYSADEALSNDNVGIISSCKSAISRLSAITEVYPPVRELADRLDSAYIELKDIAHDISSLADNVDYDPQRLEVASSRLDALYSLQQKHHVETIEELIALRDNILHQLSHIDNADEELDALKAKVNELLAICTAKAKALTATRQKAAKKIEQQITDRLIALGMPNTRFEVRIEEKPLSNDGADKPAFYFSANKNTPLQPVAQVASGGEIARVMLSLKAMISGAVKLPTIIFDEIDTGVSGRVAEMMAQIMKEMGDSNRQVISITHLPQIAALGSNHYKVEKTDTADGTTSTMRQLTPEERITELAQMLSGSNITDAAIQNARSLLGFK